MKTAEYVSQYHVDKLADQISDLIVDACLEQDPKSRVAVETILGHGKICLMGEITTRAEFYPPDIIKKYLNSMGFDGRIAVTSNITQQSPDIAQGVDNGGAGDQGVMVGYACQGNEAYLPMELYLARELLSKYNTDAKSQVTLDDEGNPLSIVLSVQGKSRTRLQFDVNEFVTNCPKIYKMSRGFKMYCNNTGNFNIGGWEADSGCTGRKIVIDQYGPNVPVGGGAFSGKDPTKVDRSGAYMARWIALQFIKRGAKEALVKLGYVIGGEQPVMKYAVVDGKKEKINYDCRPQAIIEQFDLLRPIYLDTAKYGHFGLGVNSWDSPTGKTE